MRHLQKRGSRKGSVTIYIIIGIIILIVGSLGIVYKDDIKQAFTEALNPEAKDLRLFVETCLAQTTEDALRLAALQGGYLELPSNLNDAFAYLPPPPAAATTPYWWFRGRSYVPQKELMQRQFSDYVNDNVASCLNNFESLERLEVAQDEESSVEIILNPQSVDIVYTSPITVNFPDGKELRLSSFKTDLESKFFHLYEAAKQIMEKENQEAFLEDLTIDMIATADGAGDSPHFPFEGFDVRCGRGEVWSEQTQLVPQLQRMVKSNLHFLSFDGMQKDFDINQEDNRVINLDVCVEEKEDGTCKRTEVRSGKLFDYYQNFYNIQLERGNEFSDIRVSTQYDESFPMDLDVDPSRGDMVRGFDLDIPILGSCIKVYHHRYDIEYAILFQLEADNDPLVFAFATPVLIEKNNARRQLSPYALSDYFYSPDAEQYCENALFQRDIFVKDSVSGEEIEGATVNYQCVKFNCDLGETKFPEFQGLPIPGSVPVLRTGFPECVNGFLGVEKEGYIPSVLQYTVNEQSFTLPAMEMTPLRTLKVAITVVETSGNNILLRSPRDDESVYLTVFSNDNDYEDSFLYPENEFSRNNPFELILDDSVYDIDVKLLRESDVGSAIPVGGLTIGGWTVSKSQLDGADAIRIYVLTPASGIIDVEQFVDYWQNVIAVQSASYQPTFS